MDRSSKKEQGKESSIRSGLSKGSSNLTLNFGIVILH